MIVTLNKQRLITILMGVLTIDLVLNINFLSILVSIVIHVRVELVYILAVSHLDVVTKIPSYLGFHL